MPLSKNEFQGFGTNKNNNSFIQNPIILGNSANNISRTTDFADYNTVGAGNTFTING